MGGEVTAEWLANLTHDNCEVCGGARGGVRGNENVISGVIVCDYCTSTIMSFEQAKEKKRQEASSVSFLRGKAFSDV